MFSARAQAFVGLPSTVLHNVEPSAIVEVGEAHIHRMGHLKELETSLDVCGMQKDTIIMVGPATGEEVNKRAEREQQDSLPLPSASNVKVLWREDKTYVVSETIDFSKEELKRLLGKNSTSMGSFTRLVRERWHGRYIKPKDLHYTTMKEAVRDLNLIRDPGNDNERKDPTEVDEVFRKIRDDSWTRWLDPEGTQIVPDVFLSLDFSPEKHKVDEALFPCHPDGQQAQAQEHDAKGFGLVGPGMADVDSDLFGKLAHQAIGLASGRPNGPKPQHPAYAFQGEDAEKATGSFLEEAEESSEERLFDIWLASKGQLKFTCRRLLESVRGELTNFEGEEEEEEEEEEQQQKQRFLSLSCTKFLGELEEAFMKMIADLNRTCPGCQLQEFLLLLNLWLGWLGWAWEEFKYKQDEIKVPLSFLSELEKMADAKILKRANTRQQLREKAAQRKNLAFTVEKILCSQSKGLEVPGWRDASKHLGKAPAVALLLLLLLLLQNFNECLSALPDLEKKWLQVGYAGQDALVFLKEQAFKHREQLWPKESHTPGAVALRFGVYVG
ncbi:hypothetical protein AK812_SmicGene5198 [Symbiodinium microadriaticum]|uniref:Uncharacterized protein n=1 Tax=Symbiodinium microadriaticum TaxID=2951 RepID=A0A1Q9EU79_SYMMI|nr:hypothetical protein AK812_SmicGene5198 [Symbiodinium microadriaticum]